MNDRTFVDTNILLIYAYDSEAGKKHRIASELIEELWKTHAGGVLEW